METPSYRLWKRACRRSSSERRPRRQQLHSRVADVMESRHDHAPVDQAHHLFMAGRNQDAVAMSMAAAENALQARAYRDAAELLERAAPYVADRAERARMLCRAGEAYHDNAESESGRRVLEAAVPDLERAGFAVEAAIERITLGRSLWELMRSDLARDQFELARVVLEPNGPSEALANLYIRISSLATFNGEHLTGIGEGPEEVFGLGLTRRAEREEVVGAPVETGPAGAVPVPGEPPIHE